MGGKLLYFFTWKLQLCSRFFHKLCFVNKGGTQNIAMKGNLIKWLIDGFKHVRSSVMKLILPLLKYLCAITLVHAMVKRANVNVGLKNYLKLCIFIFVEEVGLFSFGYSICQYFRLTTCVHKRIFRLPTFNKIQVYSLSIFEGICQPLIKTLVSL